MKILLISSFLPYPLYNGGHVRLYNLLKELSSRHEVTLVCEQRSTQTQEDINSVKKFCKEIITIPRRKQWSTHNLLKTAISTYPFLLTGHTLPQMKTVLRRLLSEKKFDVVHIETFYVYQNLPKTYLPTVLVEHNVEYHVYERFAKNAPLLARPLLQVDIEKIKHWERLFWRQATKLVAVSESDKKEMKREDVVVVANGVDLQAFPFKKSPSTKKEKTVLFMGDFKWIQNRDSALFIIKKVWPKIQSDLKYQNPDAKVKLWIVGKHVPDSLKELGLKDIIFDENAPDKTSEIYKKADVLLSPIRVGGGSSYKILEAMASGVPVVTTELGVKGLNATLGKEALGGETPEELAHAVTRLFEEKETYEKVRKEARTLIEKKYSWKEIAKILEGVYKDACTD